ncbi:3237_t:CDS:2 [Acaulospora colombiana]|uniref:3237_t:CDS:1 n=1 Tax=Acaulospora colombiana TaxID=27376 RepID=A0ACA9KVX2_9GLOM|nr:3237_t:CDS:2 [Acaulospora colombiana]
MVELLYEIKELALKYRKTENKSLLIARGSTLLILGALLCGYFAIIVAFLATDKGVIKSQLQQAPQIPIPGRLVVVKIFRDTSHLSNSHLHLKHTYATDGSESTSDICAPYVTQPACNKSDVDARWHGWFTATEGLVFNQTKKLNAVWYTISIDDPRYTRGNDTGMLVRAFDSDFNPRTVPASVHARAQEIDPEFYATLENLNLHVIGFQQVNWMFINRHIRKKMVPSFWAVLGVPPSYFDTSYITTRYESVTDPKTAPTYANQSINGTQLYSNLYMGAMDWFQDAFCLRRRVKRSLHKQYPKSIPLIEKPGYDETIIERINYLEQFLKQFICDVDYMEDARAEKELNEADGGWEDDGSGTGML